ncbi:MmgE/PrpD family protein [Caballeronia sp. LZ043]|uniref:MmgE/PrpD family protein n=1 Tax=Caballeronia sp. LZ043 TaxID=3038569 RepID=UPI002857D4CC|nr:MmgE/PrpD family protein [Caballeronia sp. LZ043]MDR5821999.1 MmgE/PrpD family protein [Caballeronia sp. LZ043]
MSEASSARYPLTRELAETCLARARDPLPAEVIEIAKHSLLDWLGTLTSGWADPSVGMLEAEIRAEEAAPRATLLGSGARTSVRNAALVNGMASHVLDFDDVHLGSRVHPSVPLWSAILAIGERDGLPGQRALAAFVAGVEMQSRIALVMGEEHYKRGWHNTATFGMFGAALASATLLDLTPAQTQHALGIAATQSAGLRAAFGTMCKPLHAGHAAASGVLAASLAKRGFTSQTDMLECEAGFIELYASARDHDAIARALANAPDYQARTILFKYNASCYGTQGSIEASKLLREQLGARLDDIERIEIRVEPQYLSVCCIPSPTNGLEAKFSIAQMVALTLAGWSTVDAASYGPAALDDAQVGRLRRLVTITPNPQQPRASADVAIVLKDGTRLEQHINTSRPEQDLARQERNLSAKAGSLLGERLEAAQVDGIVKSVLGFEKVGNVGDFIARFAQALRKD